MTERMVTIQREKLEEAKSEVDLFLSEHGFVGEHTFRDIMDILRKHRVLKHFCDEAEIPYATIAMYRDRDRRERSTMLIDMLDALGYDVIMVKRHDKD